MRIQHLSIHIDSFALGAGEHSFTIMHSLVILKILILEKLHVTLITSVVFTIMAPHLTFMAEFTFASLALKNFAHD
jgi:hypothetical protein